MLWDKKGNLTLRKSIAEQYPPKLKKAIIGFFGFEAGFSLMYAESNARKNDIHPLGYQDKVNSIFTAAGTDNSNACIQLRQLIDEVKVMHPGNE